MMGVAKIGVLFHGAAANAVTYVREGCVFAARFETGTRSHSRKTRWVEGKKTELMTQLAETVSENVPSVPGFTGFNRIGTETSNPAPLQTKGCGTQVYIPYQQRVVRK
jgi:hypothetical protein